MHADGWQDLWHPRSVLQRNKIVGIRSPLLQCESKKIPYGFLTFSQTVGNFYTNFTHLLNVHFYTRLQIFITLFPTLTKLCHTKREHPAKYLHFTRTLTSKFVSCRSSSQPCTATLNPHTWTWTCFLSKWRHCWHHVISDMFVDIIKVFIL